MANSISDAGRLFVVAPHGVGELLVARLSGHPGLNPVGSTPSMATALEEIPMAAPRLAILSMELPDGDGISLCAELRRRVPHVRSIIHAASADPDLRREAAAAGAWSTVLKRLDLHQLVTTLISVSTAPEPRHV